MNIYYHQIRISRQFLKIGFLLLILLSALVFSFGSIVHSVNAASTITIKVNTTTDANSSDDFISLREAILLVNGGTSGDGFVTGLGRSLSANESSQIIGGVIGTSGVPANIVFTDLAGSPTIALQGGTGVANESLPPVLQSGVVIDGLSGTGLPVMIDGSGAGVPPNSVVLWLGWATDAFNGIPVNNITVRNIYITGAKLYGIYLDPASNSLIENCTVTQTSPSTDPLFTSFAIFIQGKWGASDTNTIQNCTVGGNASLGIVINRPGANHNIIQNNRIGTNFTGTSAWPNTGAGLALFTGTHDNLITDNLISGNTLQGIYLSGTDTNPVNNNQITSNRIGTAIDGTTALPNVQGIVFDNYVINTTIGGTSPGQGNIIAFNTESGIVVFGNNTIFNQFRRNSIFQNNFLGIDLLDDKLPTEGVSGGTVGPNELALRPTITDAKVLGALGTFNGFASPDSTIELFVADPSLSGYGSGKTYCATTTADASGSFSFAGRLDCVPGSAPITGTSILVDGSTSEFGNNILPTKLPSIYLPIVMR
jgi:parallel beta-helix repeat protein